MTIVQTVFSLDNVQLSKAAGIPPLNKTRFLSLEFEQNLKFDYEMIKRSYRFVPYIRKIGT